MQVAPNEQKPRAAPHGVRRATAADVEVVSAVLSRAFARNPFVRWIMPDDRHYERNGSAFFRLGVLRELRDGEIYTTHGYAGAALWLPPHAGGAGVFEQFAMAKSVAGVLGRRSWVGLRALLKLEALRPRWPNWYLTVLGTEPGLQGTGVGTRLLTPVLARCDREGVSAYLESSDPANVPYYRRFGFEVTGEAAFRGGPTLPLMTRAPR